MMPNVVRMDTAAQAPKIHLRRASCGRNLPVKWRGPAKYAARTTKGSWATAPYLHNGSVPNLYELLLPAGKRSPKFSVGSRQYDVEKLGYVNDDKMPVFDTSKAGNSNTGHDGKEYGTQMSDEERKDLLEYLKSQ